MGYVTKSFLSSSCVLFGIQEYSFLAKELKYNTMKADNNNINTVKWIDIDKTRFYTIGTGMYSGLTVLLHPITVIKIRQQILNDTSNTKNSNTLQRIAGYYRGLPIVLSIAVPTRALYIAVLEESRLLISNKLRKSASFDSNQKNSFGFQFSETTISSLSGGIAGGIAGATAQLLVVPMDVISQKQMIAVENVPARKVINELMNSNEGWRGLYRGFGISIFNALPTGSIWWATYGGMQEQLSQFLGPTPIGIKDGKNGNKAGYWNSLIRTGVIQFGSGISAAIVAGTMTQPLDVIKTRLQVMGSNPSVLNTSASGSTASAPTVLSGLSASSVVFVTKELATTEGIFGFFRGTGPRVLSMGIWGTVLSSAYEYLKFISKINYKRA